MSIYYPTSTVYGIGQKFAFSQDQGSTYLGMAYTDSLTFTPTLSVTEPRSPALLTPTVANYPIETKPFFMGSFDGFWIHKLYVGDTLVGTVQTVNQEFFAPVFHDRVESVSMGLMESIPCPDCPVRPPVPAPSALLAIGLGIAFFGRKKTRR
jgi:hypothetical protein